MEHAPLTGTTLLPRSVYYIPIAPLYYLRYRSVRSCDVLVVPERRLKQEETETGRKRRVCAMFDFVLFGSIQQIVSGLAVRFGFSFPPKIPLSWARTLYPSVQIRIFRDRSHKVGDVNSVGYGSYSR